MLGFAKFKLAVLLSLSALPFKVTAYSDPKVPKEVEIHFLPLLALEASVLLLFGDTAKIIGALFLGEGRGGVFPHFLASSVGQACFILRFWGFLALYYGSWMSILFNSSRRFSMRTKNCEESLWFVWWLFWVFFFQSATVWNSSNLSENLLITDSISWSCFFLTESIWAYWFMSKSFSSE